MIRIQRPEAAPRTLAEDGARARADLEAAYLEHPREYQTGELKLPLYREIYSACDVKQTLIHMQHGKCAFCEAKITHIDDGDVEHFRPKRAWKQGEGDTLHRPGYYWLTYEWRNLLLACTRCNQRHKGNLFPLHDPAARAHDHNDDPGREEPVFIDPSSEDPSAHITFNRWDAAQTGSSARGRKTIEALGLNRGELREHRRERYQALAIIHEFIQALRKSHTVSLPQSMAVKLENAQIYLQKACRDDAEYSAMTNALLRR